MRFSTLSLSFAMTLGMLGAVACGPATPEPVTPAAPPAAPVAPTAAPAAPVAPTATPAAPAAPVAFTTMTHDQKIEHMKAVVTPTMSKLFQAADGKRYADFGCKTCHGDKKQDPHVVIAPLTLSGDGFKKLATAKPEVVKFMAEQVTPAMVKAMGAQAYDPVTHKGFGCGGCHKVN